MKKVEYFALVSKIGKEIKSEFGESAFCRTFSDKRKQRADYRTKYWAIGEKTRVKIKKYLLDNYGERFYIDTTGNSLDRYNRPGVAIFPKFRVVA